MSNAVSVLTINGNGNVDFANNVRTFDTHKLFVAILLV